MAISSSRWPEGAKGLRDAAVPPDHSSPEDKALDTREATGAPQKSQQEAFLDVHGLGVALADLLL